MKTDNRLKMSWIVVTAAMAGIMLGISVSIINLYHSKKDNFALEANSKIVRSLYDLNVASAQDSSIVSVNRSYTVFSIIKDGVQEDFPIKEKDVVDVQYKALYEIRDTTKWTLEALYAIFREKMGMEEGTFPVTFRAADSTGRVLDSLCVGNIPAWMRIEAKPVSLGLLEKHVLEMELMFPLRQFWEESKERFMLLGGILVWMVACIMILIFTLRRERERSVGQHLFVDTVVHNLRSPLAFITLAQGEIRQKYASLMEPKHVNLLDGMEEKEKDAERAIARLLTLSDLLHRIEIYPREMDLKVMLENLKKLDFVKIPEGKEVSLSVCGELPDPVICADAVYLPVVFENLVANAVKYSGEKVSIEVNCEEKDERVEIRVKDNGIGISPRGLKHVFDVYYREPAVREDKGKRGFGIGLSFVRSVVTAHGGKVRVASVLGEGTEFVIVLPKRLWKRKIVRSLYDL